MSTKKCLALIFSWLLYGCVDSNTVECFGNLCPRGTVCSDTLERCVDREQIASCTGLVDGDPCRVGGQPGVCAGGLCGTGCGDGIVAGDEVCDGSEFGSSMSCFDFDFYTGTLVCADDCTAISTESCSGYCGDGERSGPELCDPEMGNKYQCFSGGYDGGEGQCGLNCQWPSQGCFLTAQSHVPGLDLPLFPWDIAAFGPGRYLIAADAGSLIRVTGDFQQVIPTPAKGALVGLWAPNEDTGYAVSLEGEIVHLEDGEWVLDDGVPDTRELVHIHGLDQNRIWAVGGQSLLHFDGSSWQVVSGAPTPDEFTKVLANEGAKGTQLWLGASEDAPLHLFENGAWTSFDSLIGFRVNDLFAASPSDVFVSLRDPSPAFSGKLVHLSYDGAVWKLDDLSEDTVPDTRWLSIAGTSPNHVYATNMSFDLSRIPFSSPFVFELWHSDGSAWQKLEPAPLFTVINRDGTDASIGLDAQELVVGGDKLVGLPYQSDSGQTLRRYDGSSWIVRDFGFDFSGEVSGAALMSPGKVLVTSRTVGDPDPIAFVWTFEVGVGWTEEPFPLGTPVPMHHAFTPDKGATIFAVGEQGAILVRSLGSWSREDTVGAKTIYGVHGRAADDVYAVGDGVIFHFDGSTWTQVYDAGSTVLLSVWEAPSGFVVAVGSDCKVLTSADGATWSTLDAPCLSPSVALKGVYATGPDNIHVSASEPSYAVIYVHDGTGWNVGLDTANSGFDALYSQYFEVGDTTVVGVPISENSGEAWRAIGIKAIGGDNVGGFAGDGRNLMMFNEDGFTWELQRLSPWNCSATETVCNDRMDNDCDGLFDADDSDCP